MRIAHVIPYRLHPYSGILSSLAGTALATAARGVSVELWAFADPARAAPRAEPPLTSIHHLPMQRLPAPHYPLLGAVLADTITTLQGAVDVVHLHGVFQPINNLIARRLTVPYVVSPHGSYAPASMAYHRTRKRIYVRLLEMPMLTRAATVHSLCEREAGDLRSLGYAGRIAVVPNGVDPAPDGLDRTAFRRELGVRPNAMLALYAGRIDVRHKRLDAIIDALPMASEWHVALLGGDFRGGVGDLRQQASRLGVEDRLYFPPPRRGRDLIEAMGGADAFVLLSQWEGMSMALLEATSAGVPVVISPEVEATSPAVEAGAGLVAPPGDLARALRGVGAADRATRAAWSAAALRYAAEHTWERTGAQLEHLYTQILAGE